MVYPTEKFSKIVTSLSRLYQSPFQRSHDNKAVLLDVVCTRDYGIQCIFVLFFYLFCVDITDIIVFAAVHHAFGSLGLQLQHQILSEHFKLADSSHWGRGRTGLKRLGSCVSRTCFKKGGEKG